MSTAPQGWQNPKTNWQAADIVHPSDVNRIEGNIQAIELGQRTLDPSQAPTGNTGNLRQLLDWFANRIQAITGMANWWQAPPYTLGQATSAATANRLVARDSAGRAKVAAPSASDDIATKGYVDQKADAVAAMADPRVRFQVSGCVGSDRQLAPATDPVSSTLVLQRFHLRIPAGKKLILRGARWNFISSEARLQVWHSPLGVDNIWSSGDSIGDIELSHVLVDNTENGYDLAGNVLIRARNSGSSNITLQPADAWWVDLAIE